MVASPVRKRMEFAFYLLIFGLSSAVIYYNLRDYPSEHPSNHLSLYEDGQNGSSRRKEASSQPEVKEEELTQSSSSDY
jgi:hypothetical protein